MKTRRLFAGVGVEGTEALEKRVQELQQELKGERIRWVRLDNLHLTLEFFGDVAEDRISGLQAALAKAASGMKAFALKFGNPGFFGGARHPRVLWLGIESEGLAMLHDRVEACLREAGWEPEDRGFSPHLTLGRMDRRKNARPFSGPVEARHEEAVPGQTVKDLVLFESLSGRYVPVGRWPLE
jgi:RNA 2',3'-cyclic 3'-phosphodiesterase